MIIMKFGGTSVGSYEAISRTIGIIESKLPERPVVCVSAFARVTDSLNEIAQRARVRDSKESKELIEELRARHLSVASALMSNRMEHPETYDALVLRINELCDQLTAVVNTIETLGELPDRIKAVVLSFGELLSSTVISAAMNHKGIKTALVDARKMIITDSDYMNGVPDMEEIFKRVPERLSNAFKSNQVIITQGFISSTLSGVATVLGRGGSDYSASIIGAAAGAQRIEIWTDVDGVRTSDPRLVLNTCKIPQLSFAEAEQMAFLGAKVLHPMTIAPAIEKNIPIYVLNSMNPSDSGTLIEKNVIVDGPKAVAFKKNIYFLRVDGIALNTLSEILEDLKQKPDFLYSQGPQSHILSLDLINNIANLISFLATKAEINLSTAYSQVSIVGRKIEFLLPRLEKEIASLGATKAKLVSENKLIFIVKREDMDSVVREIHSLLFENISDGETKS